MHGKLFYSRGLVQRGGEVAERAELVQEEGFQGPLGRQVWPSVFLLVMPSTTGITNSSSSCTTSCRDSLAFKPLFLRNALHCVCLPGASPNSAVSASGLDRGHAVLRRSNVALIAAERTGPLNSNCLAITQRS